MLTGYHWFSEELQLPMLTTVSSHGPRLRSAWQPYLRRNRTSSFIVPADYKIVDVIPAFR